MARNLGARLRCAPTEAFIYASVYAFVYVFVYVYVSVYVYVYVYVIVYVYVYVYVFGYVNVNVHVYASGGFTGPYFEGLLMMTWGGVGWGGVITFMYAA